MSSGAGSGFYDFSLFYLSDELADVTLQLVAPIEEHLMLVNQAGRLSLALINEQAEDLPAHGVVWAACSPYFLVRCTLALPFRDSNYGAAWHMRERHAAAGAGRTGCA